MVKGSRQTASARAKMSATKQALRALRGPRLCQLDGCGKNVLARGWCSMHYSRMYRHGDMSDRPLPQFRPGRLPWNAGRKTGIAPWLGKKRGPHSEETRAKMRAAALGIPKSPEHAAHILASRWQGTRTEYKGVAMRSSYEVWFAQACDAEGIAWRHEPQRFNLGTCSYLPDFYLPALGLYVEVKGYFSDESQRKVALFRQLHPENPLVVVRKYNLEQFANGMKLRDVLRDDGGEAIGCPGMEDRVNGLGAQQCAHENGVNCGNPTAAKTPRESAAEPRRNARKVQRLELVAQTG